MILPIYLYGQSVLRRPADEVEPDYPELKQLIQNMYETLERSEGCGLAAPQVGLPIRLFIVDGTTLAEDYPECAGYKKVYINPEVIEESDEDCFFDEGCLSLPGISESVKRPQTVTVNYLDENFEEHEETLDGFAARIFQHEYDHLDGHVFTDRIAPLRKAFVRKKLEAIAKGKIAARYKTKRN